MTKKAKSDKELYEYFHIKFKNKYIYKKPHSISVTNDFVQNGKLFYT